MRLCWHGYAGSFADFKSMPISERYLAAEELNSLIEISNEKSSGRPKDDR